MTVCEYFNDDLSKVDVGILGTDISVSALEKAVRGVYPPDRVASVPLSYRYKYFEFLGKDGWAVSPVVRELVLFRRLNLIREDYPFKGTFQAIFCRNVMIYFDSETRKGLIQRLHRYTDPGGYLFVGHSESVDRGMGLYQHVGSAVYQRL